MNVLSPSEVIAAADGYSIRMHGSNKYFSMSLLEMDAYIRRHMPSSSKPRPGLALLDGMMTALIVDPTPSAPVDVVRVMLAASDQPDDDTSPEFLNFCGAVYARYTHITHSLKASPSPDALISIENRTYPDAFAPLLSPCPGDTGGATHWCIGFDSVVAQRRAAWTSLTAHYQHHRSLQYIYYFVPNSRGEPTANHIRNHSPIAKRRYATLGIPADVIAAWRHFRPLRPNPAIAFTQQRRRAYRSE